MPREPDSACAASAAIRATPSARESKMSASSAVIVTAWQSARPIRALHLTEGLHQRLEPPAQWGCKLHSVDDAAVLGASCLQVHTADVPTDHVHSGRAAPLPSPSISRITGSMEIIPVIDLRGGQVVRARMGARDQYRPIETPLSPTSDPLDVTRGLLSVFPFRTLYVADLDAIEGTGNSAAVLARLMRRFRSSPCGSTTQSRSRTRRALARIHDAIIWSSAARHSGMTHSRRS